jgi:hypothetical protein
MFPQPNYNYNYQYYDENYTESKPLITQKFEEDYLE